MAPRTEEQYREIREEKKALIRQAALELFAKDGYHATSISKIAEKANISKGLIYNYFESKEAVIRDLLDDGIQKMLGGLDMNKDGVLERDEVEHYLNEIFDIIKANPEFWKLYFSVSLQPAIYNLVKEKIEELTTPIFKMITNYFKKQGFASPETETLIFAALLDGVGFHFIMDPEHYPIDNVKNTLIERYVKFSKTK
jgi:AcrR family transcriptional regulator